MYVIRPENIRKTPAQLARDLKAETRVYPNRKLHSFSYRRDFFMTNVSRAEVPDCPPGYDLVNHFFSSNKVGQRAQLALAALPVPAFATTRTVLDLYNQYGKVKYVIRPKRHSRSQDYRVVTDPRNITENEYASVLYPKKREYRVIFVFGKPLILLRKKPNEGVPQDAAWGHVNSFFQTINDWQASPLIVQTNCLKLLSKNPVIKTSHIVAVDILFNSKHNPNYTVLEFNMCPSLSIDSNRALVVRAIQERQNG